MAKVQPERAFDASNFCNCLASSSRCPVHSRQHALGLLSEYWWRLSIRLPRVRRSALVAAGLMLISSAACTNPDTSRETIVADLRTPALTDGSDIRRGTIVGNYLAGLHAMHIGDYREAARRFETALKGDPENADLQRQIFLLNLASGEFPVALELARNLEMAEPKLETAELLLAFDDAKKDDYQSSLERINNLDERGAIGVVQPLLYAWVLVGNESTDEAIEALDSQANEALAEKAAYYRGIVEVLADRFDEADRTFEALLSSEEANQPALIEAWAHVQMALGNDQLVKDRLDDLDALSLESERIQALIARVEADEPIPLPISSPTEGMADVMFTLALFFDQQNILPEAMRFSRLASFLRPDDGGVWLEIGRTALSMDNPEEAIRAFAMVEQESPYYWEAQRAHALALFDLDRKEEAYAMLDEMGQDHVDAAIALGDLLRSEERYGDAEVAYSDVIESIGEPDDVGWRLFYNRGITYERTDRWELAEADFLKALDLSPDQPFVLNYLGYSWVDQGMNLDRAKEMLHKAVEQRPRDGFIVDSLGWAFYRLGDFDQAVEYLERAVELEPGDPVLNDHLGDAYWRVGRVREARYQWDRALTLDPEEKDIIEIEAKLENGLPEADVADRG